jgi:type I restriction enzyme M protein
MVQRKKAEKSGNGANLGFEEKLWLAADKMRGHLDSAEYKHVVLGLIFLKYISDAYLERQAELEVSLWGEPDDPNEYLAENIFLVPEDALWPVLAAKAKSEQIGQLLDDAMTAIEKENRPLKGVLPKNYGRQDLDKQRLGELVDLVDSIGLGDKESRSRDVLGRVYEYFLSKFASAEGKNGGEFYTPQSVVRLLVEMIEPYRGRIYDPCCGSGGMFVQSEKFVQAHGGKKTDLSIYGQESNPTTWRLAKMNLAIRGIEANLGEQNSDTLHNDLHKDLKADYILANPPFNISDWGGERLRKDVRWQNYGTPPVGNANFAWVEHIIHHLAPSGVAGFVLANGSMSSNSGGEDVIRRAIVEADLVDCMIALPGQLFYSTQIPACLWFLARNRQNGKFRDRRGHVLFIDTRKLGHLVDRTHRQFSEEEILQVAHTYHAWRGELDAGVYEDIPGFCKSATLDEVKSYDYVLTPGRYVGAESIENDGESFEEQMENLTTKLFEQFIQARKLEGEIKESMKRLGYVE